MPQFVFWFGLLSFFTQCQSVPHGEKSDIPFGCWKHCREDDKDPNSAFKSFRPCSYSFPASRGRSGFVLKKNGVIGLIGPSAVDGIDTTWGSWVQIEKNQLKLSFQTTKISRLGWQNPKSNKVLVDLH